MYVIAKANVDLHVNDRLIQRHLDRQLGSRIFVSLAHRIDAQRAPIKNESVIGRINLADHAEHISYGCDIRLAMAEKIKILRRAADVLWPRHKEHGSLEDVAFDRARLAEAEEQPFYRVSCDYSLEVVAMLAGVVE
jgi:hypothetical protein